MIAANINKVGIIPSNPPGCPSDGGGAIKKKLNIFFSYNINTIKIIYKYTKKNK
jgi:hypothetical protein